MENFETVHEEISLCMSVIARNLREVSQGLENPEARRLVEWSNYNITFCLMQVISVLRDIEKYGPDIGEWPGFKPLMPSGMNIPPGDIN